MSPVDMMYLRWEALSEEDCNRMNQMKLLWSNETQGINSQHYILKRQTPTIMPR